MPGSSAPRSHAVCISLSAETGLIAKASPISVVRDFDQASGRSPWYSPPRPSSSWRIAARIRPSLAAHAHDSNAAAARTAPTISGREPPSHRHPSPAARSSATARAADGGAESHTPPAANPARPGSGALADSESDVPSGGAAGPGVVSPGRPGPPAGSSPAALPSPGSGSISSPKLILEYKF